MALERLGKYRLTEVLGEGAMGVVYKGFDPDIRREVAIKTLRASADADASAGSGVSYADRFRNEARAGGRLQHPGIVGVYDYGHDAGINFIAMEYVRGHTLSRYLQQVASGRLTIDDDDVLSIVGQMLEALHHAHEQGVWHRDIKPSNLIMTPSGKIKITDFGIARIDSIELTQAADLIGTPMYMAPEQFLGKSIDRRVDLYGTGVVLYQLLTGRAPFTGSPESLIYKVVHDTPVLPSQLPGLDRLAPYDPVLERALAKEPAKRFDHAMQFRDALTAVVGRIHNDAVSGATVTALMPMPARAVRADRSPGSSVPVAFAAATLAQLEATLARQLGPLAQVVVRRAVRDCADLSVLCQRLADQLSDPAARQTFLAQIAALRTGTGSLAGHTGGSKASRTLQPPYGQASGASGTLSPALLDASQRLLARQMGPIASVLVKKAAAAAPHREAFITRLVDAIDDPEIRRHLLDDLNRLPH